MGERMSAADVASLHRESRRTPRHVGGIAVFLDPPSGFDYDRLVRLVEERISLAPRYRQKVRGVPGNIANPVWVDDPRFDITYHVRRSALPRPGGDHELLEFAARIQSRLLDRSRPLWEMYLVEGLSGGRLAIVTKTHEAMVDERGGIDITQVILDAGPEPRRTVEALWMPSAEPTSLQLLREAVVGVVRRPVAIGDTARGAARDVSGALGRVTAVGGTLAAAGAALLRRPEPSPLTSQLGEQRRLAVARTRLDDYRRVRDAVGGTVNDVVLAVVSGALRGWLLARAEPLRSATSVRALVPVSVADPAEPGKVARARRSADVGDDGEAAARARHPASRSPLHAERPESVTDVRPLLIDLPVGEPDPILRLTQLRYAMATHKASGRAVAADRIATRGGLAPSTLHALGARAARGLTRRMFSIVVTNVPGPQLSLYAAGARMTEMFPVLPLGPDQALSIALTSYDGGVFYGINADRDAVPDVAVIAELIEEALEELLAAVDDAAASLASRAPSSRHGADRPTGTGRPRPQPGHDPRGRR